MSAINFHKLGFIGSGNMAQALLNGFLNNELVQASDVIVSAPSRINLDKLSALGVQTTNLNQFVVQECDVIFLCCKPHIIGEALSSVNSTDINAEKNPSPLFVSIIAGVTMSSLEEMLSRIVSNPRIIRSMPNTPCMVSEGCCVYTRGNNVTKEDGDMICSVLRSVGVCEEVPESQINIVGGLAGSGPAYIYMAIEALADGAVKMGLPRALAMKMAAQMVKGSATMVLQSDKHPGQLKDEVCSPGGTTIAAVHELEKNGLRNAFISAVEASTLRAKELA